jgi:hypothetical protein
MSTGVNEIIEEEEEGEEDRTITNRKIIKVDR